jgi:hypothetical protein
MVKAIAEVVFISMACYLVMGFYQQVLAFVIAGF